MMQTKALKLALDALRMPCNFWNKVQFIRVNEAIKALEEALATQEQGEPVAWMHVMDNTEGLKANGTGVVSITQKRKHPFGKAGVDFSKSYPVISTPLYTTPQQRKPLTDEQIWQLVNDSTIGGDLHADKFARAIEAKLKEKNT